MADELNSGELFTDIRKAMRLLYEYQRRVQGTVFEIKSLLNLNPTGRIGINKLFSDSPTMRKSRYGQFHLRPGCWAWDYLFPMAMEYYLGERETADGNRSCCLSVIQATDTGYFEARRQNTSPNPIDTQTFYDVDQSKTIALFVMELKAKESDWDAERWTRERMNADLETWLNAPDDTIFYKTGDGNHFIVVKKEWSELMSKEQIAKVLAVVRQQVLDKTGYSIY